MEKTPVMRPNGAEPSFLEKGSLAFFASPPSCPPSDVFSELDMPALTSDSRIHVMLYWDQTVV